MSDTPKITCSNPECRINETGLCVEGINPVIECSSYGKDEVPTPKDEDTIQINIEESIEINDKLYGGGPLSISSANDILRQYGAKVIACSGHSEVGKTTLFASIYDLLNRGPLDGFSFCGSMTIFAFESLCHDARLVSGHKQAKTERTKRQEDAPFFHLAVSSKDKIRTDILFSDRAGEEYEAATHSTSGCMRLHEIKRADTLLVLVDSSQLADTRKRHSERNRANKFLTAIKDASLLSSTCQIGIVMTRFDLAAAKNNQEQARAEHSRIIISAEKLFGETNTVKSFVVAARPDNQSIINAGYGIKELLDFITYSKIVDVEAFKVPNSMKSRSFHKMTEE